MPPKITKETDLKSLAARLTLDGLDEVRDVMMNDQKWLNTATIELSMHSAALKANPHLVPGKEVCATVNNVAGLGTQTIAGIARMAEVLRHGEKGSTEPLAVSLQTISQDAAQMEQGLDEALKVPQAACNAAFPKIGM